MNERFAVMSPLQYAEDIEDKIEDYFQDVRNLQSWKPGGRSVSSLCQCACAVRQRPNTDNIPYPHMPQTLLSFQQQRSVSPRRAAQHQAVPACLTLKNDEEVPGLDPDTAQKEDHGTKACLKTSHVLI